MTEKIKSVISEIENMRNLNCTLEQDEAFDMAIRSLQAWDEVIKELEEKKNVYKLVPISSTAMGKVYTYNESTICMAIDIINQHLEIEKKEQSNE